MKRRYSIVTRFLTTSFDTAEFRWIHEEGWEENSLEEIASFLTPPLLGINRHLGMKDIPSRSPQMQPLGCWVLTAPSNPQILGLVQANGIFRSFFQLHVHATVTDAYESCSEMLWRRALAHLISALFIASECDLIRVIPMLRTARDRHNQSWLGITDSALYQKVWTPVPTLGRLGFNLASRTGTQSDPMIHGCFGVIITLDQLTWWSTALGQTSAPALQYLKTRKITERDRVQQRSRRPRPNRWSKFLRW